VGPPPRKPPANAGAGGLRMPPAHASGGGSGSGGAGNNGGGSGAGNNAGNAEARSGSRSGSRSGTPSSWGRASGVSPVVQWRQEFLDVRRAMNARLEHALAERNGHLRRARSSTPLTASVANKLIEEFRHNAGRLSPNPFQQLSRGSIWERAEAALHAHGPPRRIDMAEIQAIERFYERLCHLVERQRVSDPMSISIVHKVKALLESGVNIHRNLLIKVLDHIQEISSIGGLDEHNPFVLPILHFIRQTVNVAPEELEAALHQLGIADILVGSPGAAAATAAAAAAYQPPPPPDLHPPHGRASAPPAPVHIDSGAFSHGAKTLDFEDN